MNFELTEDQRAIQDMAAAFTRDRITPFAAEWDEAKVWPADVAKAAGELGFGAIYVDDEHGGCGLTRLESVLVFEQLSQGCPSTAAMISIHNMATWMIDTFGNDAQRARFVPSLASLEKMASYCLTEPGAGSDAAALKTKAVKDGDHYVLSGAKAFISGGGASDVYVVMARTGEDGPKGISCFVVENGTPGLSFGAQEKKLGWHSQPTAAVMFDDCRIPAENLIGGEGSGFRIAMQGLDGGRLNIGACSLGGATRALNEAIAYVKERRQFGRPIADFQALQFKLADMATELEAARLLLYAAAQKVSAKAPDATMAAAMAKRLATDTGFDVCNAALQLHGGYGYLMDYPIERLLRDLRVHQILEGTNEIMRVVISRALLKD
ncbi:acyl-CoA dehydrogenase family protein [Gimibacter soli]|uniref:Acyl-CoA dehydrogenase family protein n=1 Tax=Gimibacter soli TaxID=3024400 RepID=A0AAE9XRR1_9PROT|nr:acyl-CoA dehydrogenase family protein [Gimibacter soli]WCL55151.1 acyl-CoA dehydrogenase family protein [Gimibacter soli]